MRPPLIVVGPDVPKNKKTDIDVYLQDIMVTSLDLAGIPKPEYVEFNSLLPIVRGNQKHGNYDAVYGAYMDLQRMIRADGYKLIVYPEAGITLLYDMDKDPLEMNDLSGDENYQEIKAELFKKLLDLQVEMADSLDLRKTFPDLYEALNRNL